MAPTLIVDTKTQHEMRPPSTGTGTCRVERTPLRSGICVGPQKTQTNEEECAGRSHHPQAGQPEEASWEADHEELSKEGRRLVRAAAQLLAVLNDFQWVFCLQRIRRAPRLPDRLS